MSKKLRVNHQISAPTVMLIDSEDHKHGEVTLERALSVAREQGLDLVEVSPLSKPPVCKVQDFGKYRYHQSKVEHKQRQRNKSHEVKEIRLSPRIGNHDLEVKARKAEKFLSKGDRVKLNMVFRGREIEHIDIGKIKMQEFVKVLEAVSEIEGEITRQNKNLFLILKPLT